MSEAQTVWQVIEVQRRSAVSRQWLDLLLVACMLSAMAAAEVVFLNYTTGPATAAELLAAAEGVSFGAR
ncbi:MAG TPA: hypothetical protein VFL55_23265 [Acetobacteraceae bacterium]|nr:hypothetical protein [Acetobacteraceae bacterium]